MMNALAYLIVPLLLGLWAQWKVKATFRQWSQVPARSGVTGAEAAQEVLRSARVEGVKIERAEGFLTDHYNPATKTLALSADNYDGTSIAALGIAAHEAGHALQHAQGYAALGLRSVLVPVTIVANQVAFWVMLLGGFLINGSNPNYFFLNIAIGAYVVISVFTLITLPVEFDASARARKVLSETGLLDAEEDKGAKAVLDAAAWTYIAAFVAALGNLLYLIGRRRD
jgi:Zn-dependent membrane protease YugP